MKPVIVFATANENKTAEVRELLKDLYEVKSLIDIGCSEDIPFLHFEVCLYAPIELAIERKYRVVQPGAGGHHKVARGFLPKTIRSSHEIYLPGLREAVERVVAHENEHTAAVVNAGKSWNWKRE